MPERKWDYETDVLVIGSGAAAHSAAIAARSKGADVTMLEKMASHGGTTMRSGGGFWIPNNRFQRESGVVDSKQDATRYMARYSYPHLFDPADPHLGLPDHEYELISSYYDHASETVDFLEGVGAVKAIQEINWTGKPQIDYQEGIPENKCIRGRVLYAQDPQGKMSYGVELIRQMHEWAMAHDIPLMLNHRCSRILIDSDGAVVGVEATTAHGRHVSFRARKAVIFGSGGYTHNADLMLRLQRGPHFGGCASPGNTGDFFYLATEIGAMPANTAGAWRSELVLEQALADAEGSHNVFYVLGDSMLEVNKYGVRVMDEKRNYTDRTMVHFVWDPNRAEWTNMLIFYVYDDRTASLWQGFPPLPPQGAVAPYVITADTLDELAAAIEERVKSLAPHIGGFGLDASFRTNLHRTVERYNEFATTGVDEDFQRGEFAYDREWTTFPPVVPGAEWPPPGSKNVTMYPLSPKGPYHAIILAAGTLDTNGGPMVDGKARVLDTHGKPIPGLYGAGNCIASPTANAYWGAGSTIGPALTFGHLAGMHAADEPAKDG
jgi:succinate dehydrogenase/fumarate reductase flavoprotein subunit